MPDIIEAKRLIAASSPEGMRILGMGVSRPCFVGRYNAAARAALEDPAANLSGEERRLIASFIEEEGREGGGGVRDHVIRFRVAADERDLLLRRAEEAGLDLSEWARRELLRE